MVRLQPTRRDRLGLGGNERIAGFIYIGTANERQPDRERPAPTTIVSHWTGRT